MKKSDLVDDSDNMFVRKLEAFGSLPDTDRQFASDLLSECRRYAPKSDVLNEGENPRTVHVILDGLACRYKQLPDGRRQIAALLLPGDFCDLHVFILKEMDHSIGCLQECKICCIKSEDVLRLLERPAISRAMLMGNLVDEAILREWVTNIGRRNAVERISHLLCEIYFRMKTIGLTEQNSFDLPVTQNDLADALGMSLVHTNKSLKIIKNEGLIRYREGKVTIFDIERLCRRSSFSKNYLHLDGAEPFARTQ